MHVDFLASRNRKFDYPGLTHGDKDKTHNTYVRVY